MASETSSPGWCSHWILIGFLLAVMLNNAGLTDGSSEGLYILTPSAGQLQLVNWTTGATTNVGKPLNESGWWLEDCVPTTLDQTGKWIYTLARKQKESINNRGTPTPTLVSDVNNSPLTLVAMQLADGTIHKATYDLASQGFDANAKACDFGIASSGDWFAYVSGIVPASIDLPSPEPSVATIQRLRSVAFTCVQWPGKPTLPPAVVLDQPLSEIDLGPVSATTSIASSTIDFYNRLWIQMDGGVAGAMTYFRNKTKVDRIVKVPQSSPTQSFSGLQSGLGGLYGILDNKIAMFPIDSPKPAISFITTTPFAFSIAHNITAVAFLTDKNGYVLATTDGRLAHVKLVPGQPASSPTFKKCAAAYGAGFSYEPFVF